MAEPLIIHGGAERVALGADLQIGRIDRPDDVGPLGNGEIYRLVYTSRCTLEDKADWAKAIDSILSPPGATTRKPASPARSRSTALISHR